MAGIVQGSRAGGPKPISSIDDTGTERLAVDAKFTTGFVSEVNLDETNDEVAIFGGVNGSETADAATRQIINVDATGHVRTDLAKVGGNAISVDGGRQNVNATLQIADTDSPGGSGVVTASTPRVTLATDDTVATDLTAIRTSVQIMDDWDETDRAKVNPIVGQAGVQAGSGIATASTQRVTVATDDVVTVDATDLDIRNLVFATDKVDVSGSTSLGLDAATLAALESVTVQNGAGAAAVNIQDGGNIITVDGTVAISGTVGVTQSTTPWTVAGAAADGAAVSGNPVLVGGQDGTNAQSILTDTTGRQVVVGAAADGAAAAGSPVLTAGIDISGNVQTLRTHTFGSLATVVDLILSSDVDTQANATMAYPEDLSGTLFAQYPTYGHVFDPATSQWPRQRGNTNGTFEQGNVAHDVSDAGNPVKIGGRAIAHGANPTAVAAADRTDWLFNRAGIPWVIGGHPNVQTIRENVTDAEGAQTDVALVTVGAGTKIVVTQVMCVTDAANTADVAVRLGFGAAATPTTTGVVYAHPGIPAGAGAVRGDGSGILGVGADGEDLRFTCEDPAGGSIDIVVSYYTIES